MSTPREQPIIIRRKKVQGHGHHGGAWKVAFADFMTSMMALFLVLWLVTQSSDIKSAIAGYFQDPLGRANEFGSSITPGEGAPATRVRPISPAEVVDLRLDQLQHLSEHLKQRIEESIDFGKVSDHVELALTNEGLRISLIEDSTGVFFRTGSANPLPGGIDLLLMLGTELGELRNPVIVEGHTDARPYIGRRNYSNWELSTDRANAARRILTVGGLRESQVAQVRGLADREPRDSLNPDSPRNRRVTITVALGDTTTVWPSDTAHTNTGAAGRPASDSTTVTPPFMGRSP